MSQLSPRMMPSGYAEANISPSSPAKRKTVSEPGILLLGLLVIAISVTRVAVFQSTRPHFQGQGWAYKEIALSLASGQGFTWPHGPWAGRPQITRPPLWPLVSSVPMRICPECNPIAVMRWIGALMHALTAFGVAILVWMRSRSRGRALLALGVTTLLPEVQPLLLGGFGEPLAAAILVIGVVLLSADVRFFYPALFVLSLLTLVRPNYLLLWICAAVLLWWLQSREGSGPALCNRRRLILGTLVFYIPSGIWVVRNYLVSGAFPVLAGTASTTLYGNYNSVSATPGPGFGRWIDPRRIPGEQSRIVPLRWSEAQLLEHYDEQAKKFIMGNWKVVPLLVAAHARNSFIPSPADGAHRYSFWLYRLVLYVAALFAIWQKTFRLSSWFTVLLTAAILISAMTALLYNGDARYQYPLNILLLALVFSTSYDIPFQARLRPSQEPGENAPGG